MDDLEKARDEKCAPIAHKLLNDLAAGLFPETGEIDHQALAAGSLQDMLDVDANLTTEVPYVYQLVFGALASLNSAAHAVPTEPLDDTRFSQIARKMLSILATADIPLAVPKDQEEALFAPVRDQLTTLFAQEKLTSLELNYVTDSILTSFSTLQNLVNGSLEGNLARAEAKLFSIEQMSDLTIKKLDEILTK